MRFARGSSEDTTAADHLQWTVTKCHLQLRSFTTSSTVKQWHSNCSMAFFDESTIHPDAAWIWPCSSQYQWADSRLRFRPISTGYAIKLRVSTSTFPPPTTYQHSKDPCTESNHPTPNSSTDPRRSSNATRITTNWEYRSGSGCSRPTIYTRYDCSTWQYSHEPACLFSYFWNSFQNLPRR